MEYRPLSKLFYMNSSADRFDENGRLATQRLEMSSTFRTGIDTENGELFLAVPRELSVLNESVLRLERKVSLGLASLPSVAQNALIRDLVISEVVSTNEIESIHSTRRQINDALEVSVAPDGRVRTDPVSSRRFREMAKLYLGLSDQKTAVPRWPEDIRSIYDAVMADEPLAEQERPDGKLFRRGPVEVIGGGQHVLHKGLYPESAILDGIRRMLELGSSSEMPQTYSAILCHYLFEYIHPFYDGNGRTGRYLLALYLSKPLSTLTSLSLSRTIAENKSRYYASFKEAENPLNHGELTFFVIFLLESIQEAQYGLIRRLDVSGTALEGARKRLQVMKGELGLNEKEMGLLDMLMQVALFAAFPTATLDECSESLGIGKQQVRKYVTRLEGSGLVHAERARTLHVGLTEDARQSLGISGEERKEMGGDL